MALYRCPSLSVALASASLDFGSCAKTTGWELQGSLIWIKSQASACHNVTPVPSSLVIVPGEIARPFLSWTNALGSRTQIAGCELTNVRQGNELAPGEQAAERNGATQGHTPDPSRARHKLLALLERRQGRNARRRISRRENREWLARVYRGQVKQTLPKHRFGNHACCGPSAWLQGAGVITVSALPCAMPWKQHSISDLERKVHDLQMRLLKANSELRLKSIAIERLEIALHQRCERVDQLFAQFERAYSINRRLEAECEHLAYLIAASPDNASIRPLS